MMIHAALDTSEGFSFAVSCGDNVCCQAWQPGAGRDSDRRLVPFVMEKLAGCGLSPREVDRWTVGTGPGSFAGLRCGIAMLKAFRMAAGCGLRGVPTSCAMAASAANGAAGVVGVLHDGRCGQVLLARVEVSRDGAARLLGVPEALEPSALTGGKYACGSYCALASVVLPVLPAAIAQELQLLDGVDASRLLSAPAECYPWPVDDADTESSTAPLYVRQAVFVKPAQLRV